MAEGNGNGHGEIERVATPEQEALAHEVIRLAFEREPIEESKCACPLVAAAAQEAMGYFMSSVSGSSEFITYQPHRDEDLDDIEHYIQATDRLCKLDGILTPLFNVKEQIHTIIERDSVQYNRSLDEISNHVWNYMLNKVDVRFRELLKSCGKPGITRPITEPRLNILQRAALTELGLPNAWLTLDETYDTSSMAKHHDPTGQPGVVWQESEGFVVTPGDGKYFLVNELGEVKPYKPR